MGMQMTEEYAELLLSARHIKRWSIVNTHRQQTVAEHAYLVTVLVMLLYDRCIKQPYTPERTALLEYALAHDSEESILGDIPSTVKAALDKRYPGAWHAVKLDLSGGHVLAGDYTFKGTPAGTLLKIADVLESVIFARENIKDARVLRERERALLEVLESVPQQHRRDIDMETLNHIVLRIRDAAS